MTEDQERLVRIDERLKSLHDIVIKEFTDQRAEMAEVWIEIENLRERYLAISVEVKENTMASKIGKVILYIFAVSGAAALFRLIERFI